jgi:hypothetical protein
LVWHPKASNTIRRRRLPRKPRLLNANNLSHSSPPAYEEHKHRGAEYAGCKKKGVEQQGERSLEEGDEEQWDLDDAQDELISEAPNPKICPSQSFPYNADRKIVLVDSSEPMRWV